MANPTPLINLGPGGVTRHASHLPPFYFPLGVPDVVTAPVAAFSGDVLAGSEPLAVTFADESLNTPTGWLWDFGDGSTSTSQNPTHTYTAAGTYDVTLTATNGAGSDALTQTNYVDVTPALPVGVTLAAAYAAHPDHCWQDAGRSVPCGDGDLVYTWDDLTGNSRHLVQATAKYRPRLVRLSDGTWAVAFDGLPTVPGLDTGDRLAAAFPLAQPFTRAAALQFRDLARTAFQMPLDGATASTAYYYRRPAPDQSTIRVHAGADVSSSPVAGDVDRTVQVYAGAATAVYRDGTLVLSGDAGTAAPGGVAVGRSADGNYPAAVSVARLGVLAAAADSDQRAALRAWLDRFDPPALPAAYVPAATAGDGLLLAGSTSGLALSATPPTKDGTNPVLDPLPLTGSPPDHDKLWLRALEDGAGGVRLWLGVIDGTAASDRTGWTYQTSADGRTGWVKPNLGQVTIGGNTNNNFVNARPSYFTGLDHAPGLGAGPAWLGCDEIWDAGGTVYGARLLYSDDGLAWTVGRVIATMSADGVEGGCPVRRADGRWSVYALQHDTVTGRRNVVRYDSYTADCRGGWVGPFAVPAWTAASDSRQFYRSVVRRTRGGWLALVSLYDLATQRMWVEPYASGDEGATWTQLHDSTWLPRGASGAWDEVVHISADTVTLGTGEHVVYFTGGSQPHDQPLMLSQVGVASVPAGRMVRLTGTGTHTTPAGATAGLACRVDADGTGGSVTAAVLNAGGSVISGYDDTDMTAITGAASDQLLSWGGTSALPAGADKVRFTLTSATLYGWRVA